ncbi:unnamed protein product [Ambrosiozyma monospora]|uniref:Unnamed protein product n=1 Tax=Ambrosiozyma monospora TaxID=43982 RepID=A0ACB5UC94_AMBMO|nr:unnamed protein product [Ambrosiozyma monospora]
MFEQGLGQAIGLEREANKDIPGFEKLEQIFEPPGVFRAWLKDIVNKYYWESESYPSKHHVFTRTGRTLHKVDLFRIHNGASLKWSCSENGRISFLNISGGGATLYSNFLYFPALACLRLFNVQTSVPTLKNIPNSVFYLNVCSVMILDIDFISTRSPNIVSIPSNLNHLVISSPDMMNVLQLKSCYWRTFEITLNDTTPMHNFYHHTSTVSLWEKIPSSVKNYIINLPNHWENREIEIARIPFLKNSRGAGREVKINLPSKLSYVVYICSKKDESVVRQIHDALFDHVGKRCTPLSCLQQSYAI